MKEVIEVFCYSVPEDDRFLLKLRKHLAPLELKSLIRFRHSNDCIPGTQWEQENSKYFDTADILLFLVSPDFIASNYHYAQIKRAMVRHEQRDARVIPIILRPVALNDAPFERLCALPENAKPIMNWPNKDMAFKNIASGIRKVVDELLRPNNAEEWLALCITLATAKRYEEALAACEQAISLDTKDAQAYVHRGIIFRDMGKYDQAIIAFEQAIKLASRNARAHRIALREKAEILLALNSHDEALTLYDYIISFVPNAIDIYLKKIIALYTLGRNEEALMVCDQAISLYPNAIDIYLKEAALYTLGMDKNAVISDIYTRKADALYALDRKEEALMVYDQAISLYPNDAWPHSNKAIKLFSCGRQEEGLAACDQAIRLDPDNATRYSNKGILLHEIYRYEEALVNYEKAIGLDSHKATTFYLKGRVLTDLHRDEEALLAYSQAVQLDPGFIEAYRYQMDLLFEHDRFNEALTACERIIHLAPNHAYAYRKKAQILGWLERKREALVACDQAILLDQEGLDAYEAYRIKAVELLAMDRYEETVSACEQAMDLAYDDPLIHGVLGYALAKLECYQEALEVCEYTIHLDPNSTIAYVSKGLALSGLEKYKQALQSYKRALRLNPDDTEAYQGKCEALQQLEKIRQSKNVLEKSKIQARPKRRQKEEVVDHMKLIALS